MKPTKANRDFMRKMRLKGYTQRDYSGSPLNPSTPMVRVLHEQQERIVNGLTAKLANENVDDYERMKQYNIVPALRAFGRETEYSGFNNKGRLSPVTPKHVSRTAMK